MARTTRARILSLFLDFAEDKKISRGRRQDAANHALELYKQIQQTKQAKQQKEDPDKDKSLLGVASPSEEPGIKEKVEAAQAAQKPSLLLDLRR